MRVQSVTKLLSTARHNSLGRWGGDGVPPIFDIVDGPEVYEDRDPAQREAEGPKASTDYSEFKLLDTKKTQIERDRIRAIRESNSHARVRERPLQSAVGLALALALAEVTP